MPNEDIAELRQMTAMWADVSRRQLARLTESLDRLNDALADSSLRAALHQNPSAAWEAEAATAQHVLTQGHLWRAGSDRYFLLLALAQLRKCVRLLPDDQLPAIRNASALRMLRDIDEHWDQGDQSRSLQEMRRTAPDVKAGMFAFTKDDAWLGDVSLSEFSQWIDDVDMKVRENAASTGTPILRADDTISW